MPIAYWLEDNQFRSLESSADRLRWAIGVSSVSANVLAWPRAQRLPPLPLVAGADCASANPDWLDSMAAPANCVHVAGAARVQWLHCLGHNHFNHHHHQH